MHHKAGAAGLQCCREVRFQAGPFQAGPLANRMSCWSGPEENIASAASGTACQTVSYSAASLPELGGSHLTTDSDMVEHEPALL